MAVRHYGWRHARARLWLLLCQRRPCCVLELLHAFPFYSALSLTPSILLFPSSIFLSLSLPSSSSLPLPPLPTTELLPLLLLTSLLLLNLLLLSPGRREPGKTTALVLDNGLLKHLQAATQDQGKGKGRGRRGEGERRREMGYSRGLVAMGPCLHGVKTYWRKEYPSVSLDSTIDFHPSNRTFSFSSGMV